jgi:thioredoxin 1
VAAIVAVTDADFETEVLKSEEPVLVDFWAEWCGPCHLVSPILEEINAEHGDKMTFVTMDVDENRLTPAKYEVTGIPALYVYRNGGLVRRIVGALPKAALLNELSEFIG